MWQSDSKLRDPIPLTVRATQLHTPPLPSPRQMFKLGGKAGRRGSGDEAKIAAISQVFSTYADPDDPEYISVDDSFGQICEDLGIDGASDVKSVVLLWKLGAARKNPDKPMTIAKDTFIQRMLSLNATSISNLKALLPSFDPGFLENDGISTNSFHLPKIK